MVVSGNLAVSMIRKVGLPTYEIQNKDYGYRKFNKKYILWSKIHDFRSRGISISRTAEILGVSRYTVKRFQALSGDEILSEHDSPHRCKLYSYEGIIHSILVSFPDISSSRAHEHLRENYPNFPHVCEKTVHNFIQSVRKKYKISPARQL